MPRTCSIMEGEITVNNDVQEDIIKKDCHYEARRILSMLKGKSISEVKSILEDVNEFLELQPITAF